MVKKPPLGIMPRDIYERKMHKERADDIMEAMIRYSEAEKVVPTEWVEELVYRLMEIYGE